MRTAMRQYRRAALIMLALQGASSAGEI